MTFISNEPKDRKRQQEKNGISYEYMEYMLLKYEYWKGVLEVTSYLWSSGRISYGHGEGTHSNRPERITIMKDKLSRQIDGIERALDTLDKDEYMLVKLVYFMEHKEQDVA